MALIRLTGKYAAGKDAFTLVDDDQFAFLSQWKWKAKPNGQANNVYAVRNRYVNGKHITLRLHRVILGLTDADHRDVDHINHNALDNRRVNLRAVSRSVNIGNARRICVEGVCQRCKGVFTRIVSSTVRSAKMICDQCKAYRPTIDRARAP